MRVFLLPQIEEEHTHRASVDQSRQRPRTRGTYAQPPHRDTSAHTAVQF